MKSESELHDDRIKDCETARHFLRKKDYPSAAYFALIGGDKATLEECFQHCESGALDRIKKCERRGCVRFAEDAKGVRHCPFADLEWCPRNWKECNQARPFGDWVDAREIGSFPSRVPLKREQPERLPTVEDLERRDEYLVTALKRFHAAEGEQTGADIIRALADRFALVEGLPFRCGDEDLPMEEFVHVSTEKAMDAYFRHIKNRGVAIELDWLDYLTKCSRVFALTIENEKENSSALTDLVAAFNGFKSLAYDVFSVPVPSAGEVGGEFREMLCLERRVFCDRLRWLQRAVTDLRVAPPEDRGVQRPNRVSTLRSLIAPSIEEGEVVVCKNEVSAFGQTVKFDPKVWGMLMRFTGIAAKGETEENVGDFLDMLTASLDSGARQIESALCEIVRDWPENPDEYIPNEIPLDVKEAIDGWKEIGCPKVLKSSDEKDHSEWGRENRRQFAIEYPVEWEGKVPGFLYPIATDTIEGYGTFRPVAFLSCLSGIRDCKDVDEGKALRLCNWVVRAIVIGLKERFGKLRDDIVRLRDYGDRGFDEEESDEKVAFDIDGENIQVNWNPDSFTEVDALARWDRDGRPDWDLSEETLDDVFWDPWHWRPSFVPKTELAPDDGEEFELRSFKDVQLDFLIKQGKTEEAERLMRTWTRLGLGMGDVKIDKNGQVVPRYETKEQRERRREFGNGFSRDPLA